MLYLHSTTRSIHSRSLKALPDLPQDLCGTPLAGYCPAGMPSSTRAKDLWKVPREWRRLLCRTYPHRRRFGQ